MVISAGAGGGRPPRRRSMMVASQIVMGSAFFQVGTRRGADIRAARPASWAVLERGGAINNGGDVVGASATAAGHPAPSDGQRTRDLELGTLGDTNSARSHRRPGPGDRQFRRSSRVNVRSSGANGMDARPRHTWREHRYPRRAQQRRSCRRHKLARWRVLNGTRPLDAARGDGRPGHARRAPQQRERDQHSRAGRRRRVHL